MSYKLERKAEELYRNLLETRLPPGHALYLMIENAMKEAFLAGRVLERVTAWKDISENK